MNNSKIISQFLITIFTSLLFMLFDTFALLNWFRAGLEIISRPQVRLNNYLDQRISFTYETIRFMHSGPARIADLERRLAVSEQKNVNDQISQVLGISDNTNNYHSLPAEVLTASPNLVVANHDFKIGDVIISSEGTLVGTISEVGKWFAKVRTIADSGSQFQIAVIDNGQRIASGVLVGKFGGDIYIDKILTQIELQPGQTVVTSGADDKTPPNILVGWIGKDITKEESSVYQTAKVEPAAKINSLKTVLVINK